MIKDFGMRVLIATLLIVAISTAACAEELLFTCRGVAQGMIKGVEIANYFVWQVTVDEGFWTATLEGKPVSVYSITPDQIVIGTVGPRPEVRYTIDRGSGLLSSQGYQVESTGSCARASGPKF